ncbi:MAG: DUF1800 family protein [Alphaproteobacteria bacterium]|jgi:uncharacterized protein (DUF1800 family)|nr:DUF1800 family protein [Alphaproteobacteria bacterium]
MTAPVGLGLIRFGLGLRPDSPLSVGPEALWHDLDRDEPPARIGRFATKLEREGVRVSIRRARSKAKRARAEPEMAGPTGMADFADQLRRVNRADMRDSLSDLRGDLARRIDAPIGFRQRLVDFWANHFAADSRPGRFRAARASYIEEAIRPHVAGSFATLLRAAALHPVMQNYLNQNRSVGPFSRVGRRTGRGLNENLARELLELHTLGVEGGYSQDDVTQMARLLTGITYDLDQGYKFDPRIAEPGLIEIFGKRYGGRPVMERHVHEALDDLAVHPGTAAHLVGKLARHFVADDPDPQLVAHMQAAYTSSGGDLRNVYRAMLEHPAAWTPTLGKTRAPLTWVAASLRATGIGAAQVLDMDDRQTRRDLMIPLQAMGQPHEAVPSPAGYDDRADAWITPQAVAARIDWAIGLADRLSTPPDPRAFVTAALGDLASPMLIRAARGAETRTEGVAMILAAPDFNRC